MRLLPNWRWLRILIATYLVLRRDQHEWGGSIYDFTTVPSGELTLLQKWEDDKTQQEAWALVENARNSGRDFVYIGAVKTGHSRGYMFIHSTKRHMWIRGFVPGIYEPYNAYVDAINLAKKDAEELGFRFEVRGDRDEN